MIFSLLPSSSGSQSFSFFASNQLKTASNSLQLRFRLIPPPPPTPKRSNIPRFVLLICDGCSLLCFLLQMGLLSLSLSRCPLLLLLKCVISPSHHHRASKTAHRWTLFYLFFLISSSTPVNVLKRPNFKEQKENEKKT